MAALAASYDVIWYAVFHWTGHNSLPQIVVSTAGLGLAFFLLWYFWRGFDGARLLMIFCSALAVGDLVYWNDSDVSKPLLEVRALLGAIFIWWLNTKRIRTFFRPDREHLKDPGASG